MNFVNALKFLALSLLGSLVFAGCGSSNSFNTSGDTAAATATCSVGYVYSSTYGCLPQSTCSSGYALYNNQCIYVGNTTTCASGYVYSSTYGCLLQSTCPSGYGLYNNQCVYTGTTTSTSVCPTGTYLYNNQCVSSTTTTTTTASSCQGTCSAGYVMTSYGCLPQSGCSTCFGNYGRYCIGVYGSNLWYQAY